MEVVETQGQVTETTAAPEAQVEQQTQAPAQLPEPKEAAPAQKKPEMSFKDKVAQKQRDLEAREAKEAKTKADEATKQGAAEKTIPLGDPKAAPAAPAQKFAPNLKFKVRNQEFDVPKWMQSSITDEASQTAAVDLLTRAQGLDVVKQAYTKLEENFNTTFATAEGYKQVTNELRRHYQRGDFDSFFKRLNIPVEKVLQWVADKVDYQESTPEQRRLIEARKVSDQRAWSLEEQALEYQSTYEQQAVSARETALSSALEKPEVKSVIEVFDAKVGKPGAFRDEVIRRGQLAAITRKVDLSPEDAIKEVLSMVNPFMTSAQAPQGPAAPVVTAAATEPAVLPKKEIPVIPRISGGAQSPTPQNKYKSIDDLKKAYNAMK
jgi:hypothetical protein